MRHRMILDKKRMKEVEKLLIVCFCRSLVDFFVLLYIRKRKRKAEEDGMRGGDG